MMPIAYMGFAIAALWYAWRN